MAISHSKAITTSTNKLQVQINVREHELFIDEPLETSGGQNTGLTPVETLLSAVGGCKIIMAKSFARRQKINLKAISIQVDGELDNDGFMQRDPKVRAGLPKIWCTYHIDADNTDEEIAKFVEFIDYYCPVADTLTGGTTIETKIIRQHLGE